MIDISDWITIDVLDSGPKLRPGEIVLASSPNVGLYSNEIMAPLWQSCVVSLTPQRIILCDTLARAGITLPLRKIIQTSEKAGFGNWSHPKVRLIMEGSPGRFYMVSFRSGGHEAFLAKLRPCIVEAHSVVPCAAGIVGVANSVTARQQASMDIVKNAFTDLGSLKQCLQDVLDVARKLQTLNDPAEEATMRQTFLSLGVADPVTRAGAASVSEYHAQLGKELTAWLVGVLPTCHGVLTIHDMYALYNRARGKDLVSPNDLLRACEGPHLGAGGILMRRMAGTYLVFSGEWKASYDALLGTLRDSPTLSINDVGLSRKMNISVSLARDLLLGSEAECCLCRCETRSGIEFYQNMFLSPPR